MVERTTLLGLLALLTSVIGALLFLIGSQTDHWSKADQMTDYATNIHWGLWTYCLYRPSRTAHAKLQPKSDDDGNQQCEPFKMSEVPGYMHLSRACVLIGGFLLACAAYGTVSGRLLRGRKMEEHNWASAHREEILCFITGFIGLVARWIFVGNFTSFEFDYHAFETSDNIQPDWSLDLMLAGCILLLLGPTCTTVLERAQAFCACLRGRKREPFPLRHLLDQPGAAIPSSRVPLNDAPSANESAAISIPTSIAPTPSTSVRPTPSTSVRPTPSTSVRPTPSTSIAPTPSTFIRPTPSTSVRPTPSTSVRPTPSTSIAPTPSAFIRPVPSAPTWPTPSTRPTPSVRPTPSADIGSTPSSSITPSLSTYIRPVPSAPTWPTPSTRPTPSVRPTPSADIGSTPSSSITPSLSTSMRHGSSRSFNVDLDPGSAYNDPAPRYEDLTPRQVTEQNPPPPTYEEAISGGHA